MAGEPRTTRHGEAERRAPERPAPPDEVLATLTDDRCLDLLGLLVQEERPMSVQEIAERTGDAATSVYRRLQRMADTPLVERQRTVDSDGLTRPEYETWRVENYEAIKRAVELGHFEG